MLVALLSDFGLSDHYVGVMKAEILKRAPRATLVDITHGIAPQSVAHGGFCLEQAVASFPDGTVFLCVVDPGVGSARRAVAVQNGRFLFVAPDNGLLSRALQKSGPATAAVVLEVPKGSSHTFHGRDVFAPTAGKLAAGESLSSLGPEAGELIELSRYEAKIEENRLTTHILCADHFGNLCFDFTKSEDWNPPAQLSVSGRQIPFCQTFSEVEFGKSLFLWNSSGYLELAVRNGNARETWGFQDGDAIQLEG